MVKVIVIVKLNLNWTSISPPAKALGTLQKEEERMQELEDREVCWEKFPLYATAIKVISTQQLWLPLQYKHNVKHVNIPSWI